MGLVRARYGRQGEQHDHLARLPGARRGGGGLPGRFDGRFEGAWWFWHHRLAASGACAGARAPPRALAGAGLPKFLVASGGAWDVASASRQA